MFIVCLIATPCLLSGLALAFFFMPIGSNFVGFSGKVSAVVGFLCGFWGSLAYLIWTFVSSGYDALMQATDWTFGVAAVSVAWMVYIYSSARLKDQ
jgi:hypothetical protein